MQDVWETVFDEHAWVIREVSPQGAVNYEHDPATGLRTRTFTGTSGTYAGDQASPVDDFRFVHDELGRLVRVEVWKRNGVAVDADGDPGNGQQPEATRYGFDLPGNLARIDLPNGVIAQLLHDELNRLDKLTHFAPDATPEDLSDNAKVLEADYDVRPDGRRTGVTEKRWDQTQTLVAHTRTDWDYDDGARLTDEVFTDIGDLLAELDDYAAHYTHDLAGNRLEKTTTSGGVTDKVASAFDANDRLLTEQLDAGNDGIIDQTTAFAFTGTQETGRTVTDHAAGFVTRSVAMAYDLQGRMAEVVTSEFSAPNVLSRSERMGYEYDPTGIRVTALREIDADGDGTFETRTRTEFLVDRHNDTGYAQTLVETVFDADTGAELSRVVYTIGLDEIAQTTFTPGGPAEGETLVFGHDGHGSVRVLFDLAGALAVVAGVPQAFFYDAYGNLLNMSAAQAATTLLYSGEFLDAATGQQYLRARWYNPATGRFNRLDPFFGNVQDPQSLHKYLYVHGDPINIIDPTGRFGAISLGIGSSIGSSIRAGNAFVALSIKARIAYIANWLATIVFGSLETLLYFSAFNESSRFQERSRLTGAGGLDVTRTLKGTATKLDAWWAALPADERRAKIDAMWAIDGWDVVPLAEDVDGQRVNFGVPNWAPRTVSVDYDVYYAHEVNYFFWGYLNALAKKDGQSVSKNKMVDQIYLWRMLLGDAAYGFREHDGTKAGRAAWARAGWDYAMAGQFDPPTGVALPLARPTDQEYAGFLGSFEVWIGQEPVPLP